ncbi:MAG: GmrSD restriction endonuclease domain-containing protein, partial [Gemmataceae bacterium]
VVDGQQRLTTLAAFFDNKFTLSQSDECPYYGSSSHYAGKNYANLDTIWQSAFRRYNLTLVTLPETVDLSLRLEIFRRINEGGMPLTGQDIRLSYYSQSECVRFIQAVGIFDSSRPGSQRMIAVLGSEWPWATLADGAEEWKSWWEDTKGAVGQTASEMFLWYLVGQHGQTVDDLLRDDQALAKLKIRFRGNTEEVLDIVCAQLKEEDLSAGVPRLFPNLEAFRTTLFPQFAKWWYSIFMQCGPSANVAKHRAIALLIPSLHRVFGESIPSEKQWGFIGRFLKSSRDTARNVLNVEFPEPKGKWTSQRKQLNAFDKVADEIGKL